ncbi:MAG: hypothetical protein K0Q72_3266, partial [Armatimonadetes bacterium]|nr:hypothetical protein [Armatimonadota bacterium]
MRTFRSNSRCRWLAWMLMVALVAPYLVLAKPARAQVTAPNVYVLDFNNKTKVGGQLLGRLAAAQTSLQLSESDNWFVIPDAQVQRRIQELNLQTPFDRPARVQIANGIDATGAVYGSVLEARVTGQPTPQAYVKLQVVVEDITTGVLINGAVAEGASTPRMGFTGDADILLEEALGKAAFKARESMDRFRLPEGTVLNTTVVGGVDGREMEALMNIGARQGVRRGMEMIVTRQRQLVGRMKVVAVDADISTGTVLENTQGVRPEDRVTAIFNFADFGGPKARSGKRAMAEDGIQIASAKTGVKLASREDDPAADGKTGPRVARAEKGGRFLQFKAPQDASAQLAQATVQAPPPVVVDEPEVDRGDDSVGGSRSKILSSGALRMLVGGLFVMGILAMGGRGGRNATRAHEVEAFGYQTQIGAPGALIRVRWERPKSIKTSQVLQYIIWRADTTGGIRIVGAVDNDAIHMLLDSEATRNVNAYDGDPNSDDAGGRTALTNVPGILPGEQFRYQVATAYENGLEDRDNDGMPDTDVDFMSPLSMSSPWTTAITPGIITDPIQGEQVQLDTLPVMWQQTPGADTYVIWLSRDPTFPESKRVAFGPFRTLPVNLGGDLVVSQVLDASGRRPLAGAPTVYVTVGAR